MFWLDNDKARAQTDLGPSYEIKPLDTFSFTSLPIRGRGPRQTQRTGGHRGHQELCGSELETPWGERPRGHHVLCGEGEIYRIYFINITYLICSVTPLINITYILSLLRIHNNRHIKIIQ